MPVTCCLGEFILFFELIVLPLPTLLLSQWPFSGFQVSHGQYRWSASPQPHVIVALNRLLLSCVHIASSLLRLGIYRYFWPFPWVLALRCSEVPMDCGCPLLVHHAGFSRFYQPKHVFLSSLEKWAPVICIHISIAAAAAAAAAADTSAISTALALHLQRRAVWD